MAAFSDDIGVTRGTASIHTPPDGCTAQGLENVVQEFSSAYPYDGFLSDLPIRCSDFGCRSLQGLILSDAVEKRSGEDHIWAVYMSIGRHVVSPSQEGYIHVGPL
ncbi:hypothetical protein D3869_18055 (plasmid) [Azospirillum brasilense]|uniref:Uncharacterized protein n=1 Tax=Azospirillum brasilense TaxID=192 RepID=A0A4D8R3E9_AZOBR|nr:hypothetical protein D3869_18055 [Azospirillum brasilense]